jgi:ribosomal protein S18 acetylase RimI-like enzyme
MPARQTIAGVEISWYRSSRRELWELFALAEESPAVIEELIDQGRVLVATLGDEIVGCLQLLYPDPDTEGEIELAILAVAEEHQGRGIGTALVERAIAEAREQGLRTMRVGTSSADISNLRFYQRRGFRMLRIERDAFMPADGYPDGLTIDGIPLRDRVWLTLALEGPGEESGRPQLNPRRFDPPTEISSSWWGQRTSSKRNDKGGPT